MGKHCSFNMNYMPSLYLVVQKYTKTLLNTLLRHCQKKMGSQVGPATSPGELEKHLEGHGVSSGHLCRMLFSMSFSPFISMKK